MSVACWVRYNDTPLDYSALAQVTNNDTTWDDGWGLYWYGNYFKFYIEHYSTNVAYYSCDANCSIKQWNHVVGTWDNSTIKIYVNGVIGTNDSYSGVMSTKGNDLIIGRGSNTYEDDATIDDVRIYAGVTLTQAEVTDLYNERAFQSDFGPGRLLTTTSELTVTGLTASQGYILDVNDNIVSYNGGNSCVPNSASFIGNRSSGRNLNTDYLKFSAQGDGDDRTRIISRKSPGVISNLSAQALTTVTETISESLVTKYVQKVYDDGTVGWCYYTKTTIDATPLASETTPNYTGVISRHSVVQILEVY
jgi:hypothetical protein